MALFRHKQKKNDGKCLNNSSLNTVDYNIGLKMQFFINYSGYASYF